MKIHTAYFGDIPVRFVRASDLTELHIVFRDFTTAMRLCMTEMPEDMKQNIINSAARHRLLPTDRGRITNDNVIEPVFSAFAALNMVHGMAMLTDQDNSALRETGRRTHALLKWMIHTLPKAHDALGYGPFEIVEQVIKRMDRDNPPFEISVVLDKETDTWIGLNEDLPIATEGSSYDALVARVWEIAPEMAVLNGLRDDEEHVRLVFKPMNSHPISQAL